SAAPAGARGVRVPEDPGAEEGTGPPRRGVETARPDAQGATRGARARVGRPRERPPGTGAGVGTPEGGGRAVPGPPPDGSGARGRGGGEGGRGQSPAATRADREGTRYRPAGRRAPDLSPRGSRGAADRADRVAPDASRGCPGTSPGDRRAGDRGRLGRPGIGSH